MLVAKCSVMVAVRTVIDICFCPPSVTAMVPVTSATGWFASHCNGRIFGFLHYDIIILNMLI